MSRDSIIDRVKYDGLPDVLAWKHPSEKLSILTQLIVNESQEAILFRNGQALDLFPAGRYTLETPNIPLLEKVINLPTGGETPFAAEVWYVNKLFTLDTKWGTQAPIQILDPTYKVFIPIRSFGQFGVRIDDSRKFLVKMVGTLPSFDKDTLSRHFRGAIITHIKDLIASYLAQKKISMLEINAFLEELSKESEEKLRPIFADFGIRIHNFFINAVSIPDDDAAVAKLKEALATKAEMDIVGFNYQQQRSFDAIEAAASNEGGGGAGVMGAGIGMGMGLGIGAPMGGAMSGMMGQIQTGSSQVCEKCKTASPDGTRFCPGCGSPLGRPTAPTPQETATKIENVPCDKCGAAMPAGAQFCPSCGDRFNACPNCGADIAEGVNPCPECGGVLPVACVKCGKLVPSMGRFCPHCGQAQSNTCAKCNSQLSPGARFCPECGEKTGGDTATEEAEDGNP